MEINKTLKKYKVIRKCMNCTNYVYDSSVCTFHNVSVSFGHRCVLHSIDFSRLDIQAMKRLRLKKQFNFKSAY